MRLLRSYILVAALIGVAFFGIKYALDSRQAPTVEKRAEPVLSVRTVAPSLALRRPALFIIGKVEARDYASLTMPIEADVLNVAVREGAYFAKGKRLMLLDLRELEYTARRQRAELAQLESQLASVARNRRADSERMAQTRRMLELATTEYERDKSLHDQGVLSLTQLEASEKGMVQQELNYIAIRNQVADYHSQSSRLQSQLDAQAAQLAQTELSIERAELHAPFAGRVAKVHVATGDRPSPGTPLLDIFNPSRLNLRVTVPQRHVTGIKKGDAVRVLLEENGEMLTLSFSRLQPQVESGGSGIDAFFNLPRGDWVLGAVRDIVVELPAVSALSLPADAIYNDRFVYRVNADDRVEAVRCQRLGLTRADAGLQTLMDCPGVADGDRLVANQLPNLLNGAKVKEVIGGVAD